jgi:phosphatidylglycerophosphate synthase
MSALENRRPIKSRGAGWAQASAAGLARLGATPDAISAGSVAFAALGGALLVGSSQSAGGLRAAMLVAAAACVQGRLICNLLDGMVAVEHGRGSPAGPIWNELPDRIADLLLLVGAGYAGALMGQPWAEPLGWLAGALAVLTAYVRELGRGLGQPADFSGPMAKPHRMATLTGASLLAAAEPLWGGRGQVLALALAVICAGAAWTVARRVGRLARGLREAQAPSAGE